MKLNYLKIKYKLGADKKILRGKGKQFYFSFLQKKFN